MKMYTKFVLLLVVAFAVNGVICKCTGGQKTDCSTIRCAYVNSTSCNADEHFVESDPDNCICCSHCVKNCEGTKDK